MDKQTLKALKASIKHWEENTAHAKARNYWLIDVRAEACALCDLFLKHFCIDCPICHYTKMNGCVNTPYKKVVLSLYEGNTLGLGYDGITAACRRELEFLKSLLPENQRDQ